MAKISCGVRKGGPRANTRSKFTKKTSKVTVNKMIEDFAIGDKVQVVIDSSFHSGLPGKRFHGITGYISGQRGSAYEIDLKKGNKQSMVVTTPVHIKRLKWV